MNRPTRVLLLAGWCAAAPFAHASNDAEACKHSRQPGAESPAVIEPAIPAAGQATASPSNDSDQPVSGGEIALASSAQPARRELPAKGKPQTPARKAAAKPARVLRELPNADAPELPPKENQWCWAAVAAVSLRSLEIDVTIAEIVAERRGEALPGPGRADDTIEPIIGRTAAAFGRPAYIEDRRVMRPDELDAALRRRSPVILRVDPDGDPSTTNHMVVVTASGLIEGERVWRVYDPDGELPPWLDYRALKNLGWTHSWVVRAP